MRAIAYLYYDPTWEPRPDPADWGWTLDQIYEDIDPKRSQLQVLLQQATQSPPDYVVLRRLEELGTTVTAVTQCLTQLQSLKISVVAIHQPHATEQPICMVSEIGQYTADISPKPLFGATSPDLLNLLHEIQRQQQSRQICQGHARNRLQGLPPPGRAPYGYRRGRDRYVIDRSVAPVLRDFFDQFLLYGSLRGAVRYIEQKHGKKISVSTGRRWLTNPVYRGNLEYRNQEILPGTHPPIVTQEEAAQVDRLLRRNRNLAPRAASAPRSLSGLVFCQQCQSPLSVSQVTAPRKTYQYLYLRPVACPATPKCCVLAYQTVLEQTIAQVCQTLPQAVAGFAQPPLDQIKAGWQSRLQAKETLLQQLPDLVIQQILDEKTAHWRAYTLKTEIAELQNKLSQLPPVNLLETAKTVSIPQFWQDLSEPERRFYFREFIRTIEIVRDGAQWSVQLRFIFGRDLDDRAAIPKTK